MTPTELLAAARGLIARSDASAAGVWPRTAAFLARQALEDAVDTRWAADSVTAPRTRSTSKPSRERPSLRSTRTTWPAGMFGQRPWRAL